MNIHLGAAKKSLPIASANQQPDRMDTGSERDPDKILTAPNVLMVFPKFNSHSFWNLQEVCDIAGVRCPAPPLGLITVAALLPPAWNIRLVNRNAEELSDADLDWADMVMTGGMFPQQADTFVLIKLCHSRGKPVVVGGPAPTSSPQIYGDADFLVLGEAEGVIDQFIAAWSTGLAGPICTHNCLRTMLRSWRSRVASSCSSTHRSQVPQGER